MKSVGCICAFFLISISARSQQPSQASGRPKIGVALEGGGALGLAHIGVLEWFEEHHIPVDYIAGTSMGGLVGGMYATGKRPAEIRELIRNTDWTEVLSGETPYEDLDFRRKEDRRAYPNSVEMGLRKGFRFPPGLNSGHYVSLMLDREVLAYSHLKSFDDLPIPFRCVGTELVSGRPRIFKDGSLSEALRSTMSLPAVFAPVKEGGNIYADGGLLDNLPTDVVKQMGADVVVAVHLSTGAFDPNNARSLFGVLGRSISVVTAANELRGMELADMLVTVDLLKYTSVDYNKGSEIVDKGREAAGAKSQMLATLSVNEDLWQQYLAARNARRMTSAPQPQFVQVQGTSPEMARDIQKDLSVYVGETVDTAELERDLTRITGLGRFTRVGYQMTKRNHQEGLLVRAEEKDYAPPTMIPGFALEGSDPNNIEFSVGARVTFQDLGGFRSELRTDFSVGSIYLISGEYYHPLSTSSHWFVAPRADASSSPLNLYAHRNLVAQYRSKRSDIGLDVGYGFGRNSELRFGYQLGTLSLAERIGSPVLPSLSGRVGISTVRYSLDRLDSPVIPRRGFALQFTGQWFDASPNAPAGFPESEVRLAIFHAVSKPSSVFLTASGGTTFGRNRTGLPQFSLGGPARLGAYGANELLTDQYFLFNLGYLRELAQLPPLLGKGIYLTTAYEVGKAYGALNSTKLPNDETAGILMQTAFGPVLLGAGIGDSSHRKWFFQLGRVF